MRSFPTPLSLLNTDVTTDSETALAGEDFRAILSETLIFSRDQTVETFDITITDDGNYELTEEFHVLLTSPYAGELAAPSLAIVQIISDDGKH